MNPKIESDIRAHAVREYPREACGLIVIVRGKERYLDCRNEAESPMCNFMIHPQDWYAAERAGEITAVVHSHVNDVARPSEGDRVMMENTKLPWFIVHVSKEDGVGEVVATEINRFEPNGYVAPLVGRQFVHGVLDCYALVKDYYEREMNILLPEFERHDKWWESGDHDLYMENFEACGFSAITGAIKEGDVVIMQLGPKAKRPNHAAVYIGDGTILHHEYGRLSSRDLYDGYFQEITRVVIRHKDMK